MGTNRINGVEFDYDDTWSFRSLSNRPVPDLPDGITVYRSSFYWEIPDSEPFRKGMRGVTFVHCNLDNVVIPDGNTVIGGSQNSFACQNCGNDWLVDEDGVPTLPVNHKMFTSLELPMPDPSDIPEVPSEKPVNLLAEAAYRKLDELKATGASAEEIEKLTVFADTIETRK